jgi:D-alanine-D-alanine ligase-like ATP-grasp enzyme
MHKGKITVLPLRKSFPDNEFFDYEAKYLSKSQKLPRRISEEMAQKMEISPSVPMNY